MTEAENDVGQDPESDFERAPANGGGEAAQPEPVAAQQQQQPQQQPQGHGRRRNGASPRGVGATPPEKAPGRARGKAGDVPDQFDPHASGPPKWTSHEAEILWPELMQWLEANGRTAYDVMVNVIRIEPPQRASIGEPFEASACIGDGTNTPSAALKHIVEEYYHLAIPTMQGPARYELQFVWKQNGHYIANGYLSLGSRNEINALRTAQYHRRISEMQHQNTPGLGGVPGGGAPRLPSMPQPQPQMQPQYPGYFPQPQQPQMDPSIERRFAALEDENRRLRDQVARGQQQPPYVRPMQPPGFGAPSQQQQMTPEAIATAVVTALRSAGLGAPPPPPPQAMASPNDVFGVMKAGLAMMREFKKFGDEASEMFEPEDTQPRQLPQATGVGEPQPTVEDDSPYDITELPSSWDDGTKAKLVRDRETGKVDLLGMALMNPRPAQKLVDAGVAFMQRFGPPRGPGLGEAPEEQYQQPQFQQVPQQQLPPSPPPPQQGQPDQNGTGSTDEDWGNLGG